MDQITVNVIIATVTIGIGSYVALLSWIFVDNRNNTNKKIDDSKTATDNEIKELKRKQELTEVHLREFENVKFNEIMTALNALTTDIAVIKSELVNLQKSQH
jgi:ribonuclease HIII